MRTDWNKAENRIEALENPDYEYYAKNLLGTNVWVCETEMYYEEEIVLPQEVFTHDKGVIEFKFMVINHAPYVRNYPYEARTGAGYIVVDSTFDTGKEPQKYTCTCVCYEMKGDKVILYEEYEQLIK